MLVRVWTTGSATQLSADVDKLSMEVHLATAIKIAKHILTNLARLPPVSDHTGTLGHAGLVPMEGYSVLSALAKFTTPSASTFCVKLWLNTLRYILTMEYCKRQQESSYVLIMNYYKQREKSKDIVGYLHVTEKSSLCVCLCGAQNAPDGTLENW